MAVLQKPAPASDPTLVAHWKFDDGSGAAARACGAAGSEHREGRDSMNGSATLAAVLFGVIAGLRTFTAPAVVTWAVHFGRLDLTGSWLAFLGNSWVRWLLTGLAIFELFRRLQSRMPLVPRRQGFSLLTASAAPASPTPSCSSMRARAVARRISTCAPGGSICRACSPSAVIKPV